MIECHLNILNSFIKNKYLTSLISTELLAVSVFAWFVYGFVIPWPWETVLFINSVAAGYMISRCIFKNNSARKQSAWLTTEWWALILCQWLNYHIIAGHYGVGFFKIGGCSAGILIVYLITRGITKHNVNRAIII